MTNSRKVLFFCSFNIYYIIFILKIKGQHCDRLNFTNEIERVKKDLNENIEILNKQIESQNLDLNSFVFEKNVEIEKLSSKTQTLEKSNEDNVNYLKQQKTQCKFTIKYEECN